jgi:bacterioferritin-associated ferredoxin
MLHLSPTTPCGGDCHTCSTAGSCGERLVCKCLRVTESEVIAAIRAGGATTVNDVKDATGAGSGCMCCRRELKRYLTIYVAPATVAVA